MSRQGIEREDLSELMRRYEEAAARYFREIEEGSSRKANIQYDKACEVYRELKRRGEAAQKALLELLTNKDPAIRYWTAVHCLEYAPEPAERTLQELSKLKGPSMGAIGYKATFALERWRERTP